MMSKGSDNNQQVMFEQKVRLTIDVKTECANNRLKRCLKQCKQQPLGTKSMKREVTMGEKSFKVWHEPLYQD